MHGRLATAVIGLAASSLLPASPAGAAENTTCSVTGDAMTINLVGTSSYELSNDGNHVIVNDDGLTKDCTAVTGRATDTLGWIVMGAPDVEQGRDWTLHLDNPFTTNVGVTGDSSRLVHIELDDGKHSVDSLTLDASHTAVAQHWDARAFGPNQVLMDDLDTDGDADVATPGLFLVHTALRTGSGGDTIRDAGGGATYAGDGADTYTGNGTVHPGLGDDDVTLNGVGRVSFDESNDGSDHARAVPFSNPGPGDNMVVSYRPRTGGLQLSLDGEANDGDPGNSAEHDNIEPGFTVVEGESGGVNHLVGSLRAEELRGGKLADTILGEGGNDRLLGGAGNDYLSGNSGNDTFVAAHFSDGADRMLGGFGSDTVSYGGRGNSVTASIDGRANDGESGEHDSIDAYVERILGGSGPDTLIGNNGPNFLSGGPLTDHLYGKGGDDTLHSTDDFVDYVYGGTGRDRGHVDHLDRTYSIENRY